MSAPTPPSRPRLASIDRRELQLRTVDVEKLIDEDHSARSLWKLVGRLDLSVDHAQIAAVEGQAVREHTDPQLLISLWLYAYSRGISSAREIARQCEYEPGCQWLCGLEPVSHRTLSGFRSDNKAALDDLFVQVLGMLSAEGLISLERVTLDGTKIKANGGGNTFRRQQKLEAHLELAREQHRWWPPHSPPCRAPCRLPRAGSIGQNHIRVPNGTHHRGAAAKRDRIAELVIGNAIRRR